VIHVLPSHTKPQVGAVRYLNTKPLVYRIDPHEEFDLKFDYPSYLADQLRRGELDIALIPSIEYFLGDDYRIISDACIGCQGPVWSVKLFFRKQPAEVETLALDEGSRTSAALAKILLRERFGVRPITKPLPVGSDLRDADADAILLIGDRAIHPPVIDVVDVWDLGETWVKWTGLPFVFAMWVARKDAPIEAVATRLTQARNLGVAHLSEIAESEAPRYCLTTAECFHYLQDNLHFFLGDQEKQGLELYYKYAANLGIVPGGRKLIYDDYQATR